MDADDPRLVPGYRHQLAEDREKLRRDSIIAAGTASGRRDLADEYLEHGGGSLEAFQAALAEELRPKPELSFVSERQLDQYSLCRLLRRDHRDQTKTLETEISDEIVRRMNLNYSPNRYYVPPEKLTRVKRDLDTVGTGGTGLGGAAFVGSQILPFWPAVRARSVLRRLGAMFLTGLRRSVLAPRGTSSVTSQWLATEASASTASDPTFTPMPLAPKTIASSTVLAGKLLRQGSEPVEALVLQDQGFATAAALDTAALAGTGASGQPTGLNGVTGVGVVSGGSLDYAGVLEFEDDIDAATEDASALGWLTTGDIARTLKTRHEEASTYSPLWRGPFAEGTIDGIRAVTSSVVPAQTMVLGDWSQVLVAEWGVLAVETDPYTHFRRDAVIVRSMWMVDIAYRRPGAFSISEDVT